MDWEFCPGEPGSHEGQPRFLSLTGGNVQKGQAFWGAAGGLGDVTRICRNCGFVSSAACERAYLLLMLFTVASGRSGYCCNQIVILCKGNVSASCLIVVG